MSAPHPHEFPRTSVPGVLLAALLAGCSPAAPEPPVEAVLLACPEPRFDFGSAWEGRVLEHEFRFTSRGSEPAVVEGMRSDCGCTVARLERLKDGARVPYETGQPLSPGEELIVHVTYNTTGKYGIGERAVKLFCNERDGMAEVAVLADVRRRFVTEPDPPPTARMAVGQADEQVFDVVGMIGEPFLLEHEQRGMPSAVAVALQAVDPDARGRSERWRVSVTWGRETPRGTHSYPIFLRTDLVRDDLPEPGTTHVFAPFVMVEVLGLFSAEPAALSFGALGLEESVSRTVRVTCNDPDHAFAEPRVTIAPVVVDRSLAWAEHATIRTREVPAEHAWDVELVLEKLAPETEATFLGRLDIQTGHPEEPLIRVNVSGFRSDRGGGG